MAPNQNYQMLKDFFVQRFPKANEDIFCLVAKNRLKGLALNEKLEEINSSTAEALITFFKTLSPEEVEVLTLNALRAKI